MADQTTTTTSGKFSLNVKDILKGLLVAVISAVLTAIYPLFQAGQYKINWAMIGGVAVTTAIAYLMKNFFASPTIVVENPPKEAIKAVKEDKAEVKVVPK